MLQIGVRFVPSFYSQQKERQNSCLVAKTILNLKTEIKISVLKLQVQNKRI